MQVERTMRTNRVAVLIALIFFAISGLALAQPALSPVARLDQLVTEGRYPEAYSLAQEHLGDWEGEPEFDFLYGMAALEAGYPNEAVFAFERIVATADATADAGRIRDRARLELARAYLLTNNLIASETLFNQVLESNPPQNVRENIQMFLIVIAANKRTQPTRLTWSVSANLGYDDNVNSSTSEFLIDTPLIGQIQLNPDGRKSSDEFSELTGSMTYRNFITRDRSVDLQLAITQRDNFSSDQFDLSSLRGDLSYNDGNQKFRYRYFLQAQNTLLDGTGFQQLAGLGISLQRAGENGWFQSVSGSQSAIRFDNKSLADNDLRDVNQTFLSLGIVKVAQTVTNNTLLFYAHESAVENLGKHNGRKFYGVTHNAQWRMSSAHTPYARLSFLKQDYADNHPVFFNTTRSDSSVTGSLGWIWQFNPQLVVNGEVSYSDSESNITLFAYSKAKVFAGFRYQF
jgi:tetratricopeptide (TPR) repeat protein